MIKYELKNQTGVITLNRPEKRNALNPEIVNALKIQLNKCKQDESVRSVIITGEGNSFCAGADLEYLKLLAEYSSIENYYDSKSLADLFLQVYKFPKPTIAAVNGAAIAGGCGLASVCDFIVAHPEKSKFGYSEVKIGFIPAIVSIFLIKKVGEGLAKQLLLEGDIISGRRGYEIGFVNYLSEDVLDFAKQLSEKINKNSQTSIKLTKEMIINISNLSATDAVKYCINLNSISRASTDFKDGLDTFLKKE